MVKIYNSVAKNTVFTILKKQYRMYLFYLTCKWNRDTKKGFIMEDVKYSKKILNILKENKELITILPTFLVAFLCFLYGTFRYFYSIKAEEFYGVPKFYFYDNLKADYIMKIVFFTLLVIIFLSPPMIKKFSKKNKLKFFESLCYSFLIAYFVFYLSWIFCNWFLLNNIQIKGLDFVLLGLCVFISIITWILYFVVFRNDLKEYSNNNQKKTDEEKIEKKDSFELKTKEDKIAIAFVIFVTIIIVITVLSLYKSILFIPENKKNYEIIKESNTECNVVVGYYKGFAILMSGKINRLDGERISHLEILKGEYRLESIENKKIEYYQFNNISCDNK